MSQVQWFHSFFWVILYPASLLWAGMTYLRRRLFESSGWLPQPFCICVGNLHSGGSGKTPLVKQIADHFKELKPCILLRGYRGKQSAEGGKVDRNSQRGAALYGDEAWMLANQTPHPIYVGKNRVAQIKKIEKDQRSSSLVIMDDGFQHFRVKKDMAIVAISIFRSPNESFCIPMGDLRESMGALDHASAVVLTGGGENTFRSEWKRILSRHFPKLPVFEGVSQTTGIWEGDRSVFLKEPFVAFCGIANAIQFRREIASRGGTFYKAFADHHPYSESDLADIVEKRKTLGAKHLVTTDKDWYKLRQRFTERGERLYSLRIGYELPQEFWYFLESGLGRKNR